ncbi:phosphatase [Salinactinospora qingdaonensis]
MVRTGIAGQVDTPRENNLKHYRRLVEGDPYYQFGLTHSDEWSYSDVLSLMSKSCGVVADENYRWGIDTIDPDRTADALEALADRMAEAARRRERVMFATGHPKNLLETYQVWASALRERGCPIVTAAGGFSYEVNGYEGEVPPERRVLVWEEGVGIVVDNLLPRHSHDPFAMQAALAALADAGQPWPQLVIADHGFAGAAGEAGIPAIGFADSNDPALFVGEYEGKIHTTVPLDDGYLTEDYLPLCAYVLQRSGLL